MEQAALNPRLKNPVKEYLSKFDLNLCLTCGTCTNGCPVTGGEGAEGLDTRKANVVVVGCSNCHDQIMKRLPKFYPEDCKYEVKYIWELVADSLVIEPWSDEEVAKAEDEARAQWERLGVSLDEEE